MSQARATWFDAGWKFRRPVEAIWNAEHGTGEQLCFATFYTAGHAKPNGDDIRVATDEGKLVASRIIDISADRVRLIFALPKLQKNFYVYFGNDSAPKSDLELKTTSGLLLECKHFSGGRHDSMEELRDAWDRAGPIIGATMINRPFLGYNPATDDDRTISRISGNLFAPSDGDYLFAGSADDRAALFIDDKPVLLIPAFVGDIRFNTTLHLARGQHAFVVYHLNTGIDFRVSIGWRVPGLPKVDVIPIEPFGAVPRGVVGALEEIKKPMTADFTAENRGEFFVADHYLLRCRFSAQIPKNLNSVEYEWDFGDGQTASGSLVDHVFLDPGTYPVKCTFHLGANSDSQTSRFIVSRDYERTNIPADDAKDQSKFVARYDFAKLPAEQLPQAVLLLVRAGDADNALVAASALARATTHPNKSRALDALRETQQLALSAGKLSDVAKMWNELPDHSDLNPEAICDKADFLLWREGNFDAAQVALEMFASSHDVRVQSHYVQALVLTQRTEAAKQVLQTIPSQSNPIRQSALSGAAARSIEFFIRDGDVESGEDAWNAWQTRSPADFLEGYSVLLRVKLMELRKLDSAAAKVAEAFANAVPTSSYSPRLLDEASRLLKPSDPSKGAALHELLKKRYPEDPLAQ